MPEDWTKMNLAWQQQWQLSRLVVAALYAYSPQVHWASGVLDHVDVPHPTSGRPGALARLAGTGA